MAMVWLRSMILVAMALYCVVAEPSASNPHADSDTDHEDTASSIVDHTEPWHHDPLPPAARIITGIGRSRAWPGSARYIPVPFFFSHIWSKSLHPHAVISPLPISNTDSCLRRRSSSADHGGGGGGGIADTSEPWHHSPLRAERPPHIITSGCQLDEPASTTLTSTPAPSFSTSHRSHRNRDINHKNEHDSDDSSTQALPIFSIWGYIAQQPELSGLHNILSKTPELEPIARILASPSVKATFIALTNTALCQLTQTTVANQTVINVSDTSINDYVTMCGLNSTSRHDPPPAYSYPPNHVLLPSDSSPASSSSNMTSPSTASASPVLMSIMRYLLLPFPLDVQTLPPGVMARAPTFLTGQPITLARTADGTITAQRIPLQFPSAALDFGNARNGVLLMASTAIIPPVFLQSGRIVELQ